MALTKISTDTIADSAITAVKIADGTIVAADIAANSIDSDAYVDGSIDAAHLAANSVDSDAYVDASIDDAHLATGISASKLTGSLPALTLAGALTGADQIVTAINLKDYGETTNAIGGTGGGTQDINLTLGNCVSATVDTSTNTFTFSNPTASDELCSFILFLTNGGSQTVNWPGTVDWEGGTAPTLTASGVDVIAFSTVNAGTLWHGFVISTDSK
jgi:hypothetical protein